MSAFEPKPGCGCFDCLDDPSKGFGSNEPGQLGSRYGGVTLAFLNSLVPLLTLPESEWVGRTVYHAGAGQAGPERSGTLPDGREWKSGTPFWRQGDTPDSWQKCTFDPDKDPPDHEPDWNAIIYDCGPVREYEESEYGRQEHDVLFYVETCLGEPYDNVPNDKWPDGFCLRYAACFLWIEKEEAHASVA